MVNSTNDKTRDIQNFLKIIKEQGKEKEMKNMLNRMSTSEKVDNFLNENQTSEFMGGQIKPTEFMGGEQIAGYPKVYNPAGLPDDVYRSIMRQYGTKGFGPYTLEDKIRVLNYYKQA